MPEIKKEDIKQEVFDLYDDYAHNRINRRTFVQRLSIYAVGGLTVGSLMSFLMPDYKGSVQIQPNDPRVKPEYVNYSSPKGGGNIKALLAMPDDAKGKLGGIVVKEALVKGNEGRDGQKQEQNTDPWQEKEERPHTVP